MNILPDSPVAVRDLALSGGSFADQWIRDHRSVFRVDSLLQGSIFGNERERFRDSNVLVALLHQLDTAAVLLELDGLARRLVVCPPDLAAEHLPYLAGEAAVSHIICNERPPCLQNSTADVCVLSDMEIRPGSEQPERQARTEWILFTSGTTGRPKMVAHDLRTLAGHMQAVARTGTVWSTFYDIRRYGGMQILLRALVGRAPLVLSSSAESVAEFLHRAAAAGVTHISGTPSHWRRVLLSGAAQAIQPEYVRLSGEAADQSILDRLKETYPGARIVHAFASTEAGLGFEVSDGQAGFPAEFIGGTKGDIALLVKDDTLRIRSSRTAHRYLGGSSTKIMDDGGFVDTGDVVQLHGQRYFFAGRRDGIINIGGLKVHPEEVEAVINGHPAVQMSLVTARKNPVLGSVVMAELVLRDDQGSPLADNSAVAETIKQEVLEKCRSALPRHKVPAVLGIVPSLTVLASGKLARPHA